MSTECTCADLFALNQTVLISHNAGTGDLSREQIIAELAQRGMNTQPITPAVSDECLREMLASVRRIALVELSNLTIRSLIQQLAAARAKQSERSRPENTEMNAAVIAGRAAGLSWGKLAQRFGISNDAVKALHRRAVKRATKPPLEITIGESGTETT